MAFNKPTFQTTNPFKKMGTSTSTSRTIYYGEVISIDDDTDGGRIKVRIPDFDNPTQTSNENLPWAYPLLPKFFHLYPQVGEFVRVFIEDIKYPERSRFWLGSVISQQHKFEFDSIYTALSTTNVGVSKPESAISTYPDAKDVFPEKNDIGIIGKINTDVILKSNQVLIRAGKHENNNILKLNIKNPAALTLTFEQNQENTDYKSNSILMSDKIALISHDGIPKFKSAKLTAEDRIRIFNEGHPIARGDVLVEALNLMRKAIINHIHGYSGLSADKTAIINSLEKVNFENILQKNIVTN